MDIRQYRKDAKYLIKTYGNIYDFCGGWCNNDILEEILFKDCSSKNIKQILSEMMERIIRNGYDRNDCLKEITKQDYENDERLREIVERYNISVKFK